MKQIVANCSAIADDVPEALKTSNEEEMQIIFMFCSQKFQECRRNLWKKLREQWKNNQSGDHSGDQSADKNGDQQNPEERKKHHGGGRKHFSETIVIIHSIF